MAEHTKVHLWLNTSIAVLALVVSAGSVAVSWRSYQFKNESIGFTIIGSTSECKLQFQQQKAEGVLGFCWLVTISNQSESRTSLVEHHATQTTIRNIVAEWFFTTVEDQHGSPAEFPIVLDGGAAQTYVFRVPVSVPAPVADTINELRQSSDNSSLRLKDLESALSKKSMDLIGNTVDFSLPKGSIFSWKLVQAEMKFTTGRGNIFTAQMFTIPFGPWLLTK